MKEILNLNQYFYQTLKKNKTSKAFLFKQCWSLRQIFIFSSWIIDNVISAELPPDPEIFPPNSEEREQAERLESIVNCPSLH